MKLLLVLYQDTGSYNCMFYTKTCVITMSYNLECYRICHIMCSGLMTAIPCEMVCEWVTATVLW